MSPIGFKPQPRRARARHRRGTELLGSDSLKRLADLFISAAALIALAPIILATAVLVRVKLGAPVIFRQERPGLGGRPFTLFKFRTMLDTRGSDGSLLPDEQRLTPFGARLRALSLDELPELWNIVRGEMSLVGPRPLRMEYLQRYTPQQARRHEVRPGLTGLAQVRGRNSTTWAERFDLDVWYVDNHSARLDLSILARTVCTLVRRDGIAADGHVTMPEFEAD
ncbi:MAG: sugar transferase [Actinomycetia bacterium]|nr:sugar transferase [Actinomycetes bacterium]